jgi:hypothetical protein
MHGPSPRHAVPSACLSRPAAKKLRWTKRALIAVLLAARFPGFPTVVAAAEHEVTAWSFVTDCGRTAPTAENGLVRCLLLSGGYQELGRVFATPPSAPPTAERVREVLAEGLRGSEFRPTYDAPAIEQMLIYQWGYMDPRTDGLARAANSERERRTMLTLLGASTALKSEVERTALAEALADDRYFLVVSAYDHQAYLASREQRLLWRCHLSVPAHSLSHEQALPLLVGAGVALFARETTEPRRIRIPLSANGVLRLNPALRRSW